MTIETTSRRDAFRVVAIGTVAAVGAAACVAAPGPAIANQPNMETALAGLNSALGYLQRASHNKEGHRLNAINLVRQAIAEVKLGMLVAD